MIDRKREKLRQLLAESELSDEAYYDEISTILDAIMPMIEADEGVVATARLLYWDHWADNARDALKDHDAAWGLGPPKDQVRDSAV